MLRTKKSWVLFLVFCLISAFTMVMAPDPANAATTIKWSKVMKGSYNELSPYTLNWTGNVLDRGGFSLTDMAVTSDKNKADFVITQGGSIAAGGILKVDEKLEEQTDASISNFNSYESVTQGAVYLIILHDGTWAKLRIDTVVKNYMDYLSKVTFSYVIEEERIEDNPNQKNNEQRNNSKSGQFAKDVEMGLYENPFASPKEDLLHPGAEYTFEEGPIVISFPAADDQIYFDLYRSDNGGPYVPVSDFLLEEPEYVDYYVFAGHTYLYIFVAYDQYGVSEVDLPIKVTVIPKGSKSAGEKAIVMKLGSNIASVDGKTVKMDAAPVAINGRTLVPIRFIAEALGAAVDWNAKKKTATITLGNKVVVLTLNSSEAMVNGKKVMMDVPAMAKDGRTLVPIRFVTENLDLNIDFNSATKEITITGGSASTPSNPSGSSNQSNNSQNQGNESSLTPEEEAILKVYFDYLVGEWEMWIPSLDPNVPGASGGILTIYEDFTWKNVFNGKVTTGKVEIYDNGDVILIDYMFGWDWYVRNTEYGIKITSPPAAFQEGRPAK